MSDDGEDLKNCTPNISNNFFNLYDDDDDDEEDNEADEQEKEKQVRKWDWDLHENRHLYFGKSTMTSNSSAISPQPRLNLKRNASDEFLSHDRESFEKMPAKKTPTGVGSRARIESANRADFSLDSNDQFALKFNLTGHTDSVNRVHWRRQRTSAHSTSLLSSSMDKQIIIWNVPMEANDDSKTQDRVQSFDRIHTKAVRNAIWSPSESAIVSISYDQTCAITDIQTGDRIHRYEHKGAGLLTALSSVTPNGDDNLMLVGSKDQVLVWDVRSDSKSWRSARSSMGQVQDILFINEREFVSSGDVVSKDSAQYAIQVWDLRSTACVSNQIFHEKYVCTCLKKHPYSALFFAQTHGDYIAEFSTRSPFKMNKYKRYESSQHVTRGYSIGFDLSPSGTWLASGSLGGAALVYNQATSKLAKRCDAFNKQVTKSPCMDVKFHPNESLNMLAVASLDGQIKIYDIL